MLKINRLIDDQITKSHKPKLDAYPTNYKRRKQIEKMIKQKPGYVGVPTIFCNDFRLAWFNFYLDTFLLNQCFFNRFSYSRLGPKYPLNSVGRLIYKALAEGSLSPATKVSIFEIESPLLRLVPTL